MIEQHRIDIATDGRAIINITSEIERLLHRSNIKNGLCHVFVRHTSASLIITENADRNVLRDLETHISQLVRDGDPAYRHDQEGPDDMAAHIRSVLTQSELTLPIDDGRLELGIWQGVFLWEHRYDPHRRQLTITFNGAEI